MNGVDGRKRSVTPACAEMPRNTNLEDLTTNYAEHVYLVFLGFAGVVESSCSRFLTLGPHLWKLARARAQSL